MQNGVCQKEAAVVVISLLVSDRMVQMLTGKNVQTLSTQHVPGVVLAIRFIFIVNLYIDNLYFSKSQIEQCLIRLLSNITGCPVFSDFF